ncbi:HlyC/CorC family transporter [candidate division KSB1 bacterium]|nr:MAG: HlyC/CorC family transporter [candidate division KSB1 bacterium]
MAVDISLFWGLISFFLLVSLSALFSSSETALFSLTRSQVDDLTERKDLPAVRLTRLLRDPRRLLVVLLTGNTIINIIAATIAALVTARLMQHAGQVAWLAFVLQVLVVTLVIVILGDIFPKLAAIRNPLNWSLRISGVLTAVNWIFTPIVFLLLPFTDFVARTFGVEKRRLWISEDEIKTLVEVGEERGALEQSEKEMIHSIFEFGDTTVREIMVPRTDMICLEVNTPVDKLLDTIRNCQHTRIPIFENSIDNIVGILHTKDLLLQYPFAEGFQLRSILRKPIFVPESKLIHELLKLFQDQRLHMTIAVDEYGGTAGVVTLEDVIEEIVGEIQDEHDAERPLWTRLDERTVIADARMDVETVNEVLGSDVIPVDQDFETLGGFLLAELGDFPEARTAVEFHNFKFIVEEVKAHRLGRIRIIRRETSPEATAS